ncbi:MAG: TIGR03013 family PEP-CTERM/XrtA system glycosyltransferase [Gammaproteobacteria bacterium]|nr:TIGR03013 family PEP-CTERM/XrtA system glycosyltransferase [Gammaproteobacteria bacterium]
MLGRLSTSLNFPLWTMLVSDFVFAAFALSFSALARFGFETILVYEYMGPVTPRSISFAGCVVVGMVSVGMYRARQRPYFGDMVARVIVAVGLGTAAEVLLFYLIPELSIGRGILIGAALICCLVMPLIRMGLLRLFDTSTVRRRVLVLGAGDVARSIASLRRRADKRRFEIIGFVPGSATERAFAEKHGFAPLYSSLEEAAEKRGVDEIVVALDERRGLFPAKALLANKFKGVQITDVVDFIEQELEKIDLEVMYPGWFIFESSRHSDLTQRTLKRMFDVSISLILFLLMLPVFLIVICAIRLEDGKSAPIFYRQVRVGRNNEPFQLLKFRSMVIDAEAATGAAWSSVGDSRVTRTGLIIRRLRIDELPQIVNVLLGEMSIVGPRPERPEFVEQLSAAVPLYEYRHCVRPGITGWAQLNFPYGASVLDAREKLKYDLYYIKNADVIFDIFVLLQTLEVIIWGEATSMAGPVSPQGISADDSVLTEERDS